MGDVGMAGRSIADGDDYMSRDEVREQQVTFQKASGSEKGEKKKKKKKLRKKEGGGLDLDAMAAMEAASGKDHGSLVSRAARADGLLAAQLEQDQQRRERFDRALATAEEKSARLERGGAVDAMDVDGAPDGGETVMEEEAEVDVELYAALARARRLKAQESRALAAADVDDAAARRVAAAVERAEEAGPQDDATAGGVELSSLEFSQTGEFCKAVRAKDDQDANIDLPSAKLRAAKELAGNGHPAANSSNLNGAGEAGAAAGGQQVKTEGGAGSSSGVKLELGSGDGNGANGDDDDDDDDDKAEEGFMHEPKASGGLGAVLEMARRRGMLAEERDVAGRVFDQKGAGLHAYDDDGGGKEPTFTLDHYDEYGRKMTEKQAFRQLSWKFHGKAPSKKKMEKRMLEREKQISDRTEDKAMKHMAALQAAQQSTKSAHVVLTGINAIKPSEIKSVRQQAGGEGADVRAKKKAKTG
jgi:U4/U6.U5 tri-snRNP-associated protein 1